MWVSIDEALELMKSQANNYEGKFIIERDTLLLQKVKELGIDL